MAARIAPCFGSLPTVRGVGDEVVEHRLVEADLLGRHRAVVELVDAVGQLGGDLRLALRAAEHQDAVERAQRRLAFARQLGDERGRVPTRPGLVKSRIAHRSPRPFSIGVPVSASLLSGRDAAQLLARLVGRVLDRLRLVEDQSVPRQLGERVDVADGRAVGGDDDVGVGDLGRRARRPRPATRRGGRRPAARA